MILPTHTMERLEKLPESLKTELHRLIREETPHRLSDHLVGKLILLGEFFALKTGESITKEGLKDPDYYIIADGIMRCWHYENEVERTEYFGLPGTIYICYHSHIMDLPSPVTIEACCPTVLMRVKKEDYVGMIEENPEFARWCLSNVQTQMFYFEMKSRVVKGSARERYETIVSKRPEIIRNVPLKIIASYLGITPQYLSTLRSRK